MLIILLVLAAAVMWIVTKPAWLPKPPQTPVTQRVETTARRAYRAASDRANALRRLNFGIGSPDRTDEFKRWASRAALDMEGDNDRRLSESASGFAAWLAKLPEKEARAMVRDVAAFCRRQKFDLTWVIDSNAADDSFKRLAGTAVLTYAIAAWEGREAEGVAAFRAWQAAPHARHHQRFAQTLYGRLVALGWAASSAELLLADDEERRAHIVQSIQTAAVEHASEFPNLLKSVMTELRAPAPTAETEAAMGGARAPAVEVAA